MVLKNSSRNLPAASGLPSRKGWRLIRTCWKPALVDHLEMIVSDLAAFPAPPHGVPTQKVDTATEPSILLKDIYSPQGQDDHQRGSNNQNRGRKEIAEIEMSWLGDLLIEPFWPFLLAKNGAESAGILTDR